MKYSIKSALICLFVVASGSAIAKNTISSDKFRQLEESLPTPNTYRTASGAPGHQYWQQQVDYKINIQLDDKTQTLTGSETMSYTNNSPDTLRYLWIQLDQNRLKRDSDNRLTATAPSKKITYSGLRGAIESTEFDGGNTITAVTASNGSALDYVINGTMMRVILPKALKSGDDVELNIKWNYKLHEQKVLGGRSGYEYFKEDDNYLYELAGWFPRAAAYYDVMGWQNKQFLGNGEFTLEFGDYDVKITVPADHIVAATGELQNESKVLTKTQRKRLEQAKNAKKPVLIVTVDEALENEKSRSTKTKTWHFKAKNVRDFAFASSRKFIWDAQAYKEGGTDTMAMSFYPNEGNPLWEKYSTEAIIHTMQQYNKYTFAYPYPVSISVNGPVGGMEYPMITFNGPRPTLDKETGEKTYSRGTKYGLVGVIIHEVGHNYFPMIVNSDERQWTWMDEGLNTFLQFLAQQAWEEGYPSRRGHAADITNYMKSTNQVPIMTNSESILQFGNNAYGKPATALNILRETVMGRELFDFAFKEYAQRWMFKRPTPSDFFRTMEDASAVDLDWFWRGWFYTTDHVDIALGNIHLYRPDSQNPDTEAAWNRALESEKPTFISDLRDKGQWLRTTDKPELLDFYNEHDKFTATNKARNTYNSANKKLEQWQKDLLVDERNFYIVDFENKGGLVMPIIVQLTFADKTTEQVHIPAEIWRKNSKNVSKLFITDKEITAIAIDPNWETADVDVNNNYWPARPIKSSFELYKRKKKDMMRDYNVKLKSADDEKEDKEEEDK
ncbi:M1 family metallopeptidase [Colwellia sp. BRX8-4]|uniref:M1 family metallopeptidase n=1 Tax=Colwellia sp. BRX8-4 TaxID=2759836 RepID=UPI0015F4A167|nr:M1 family metallopeptidase [Colwellia sp. BRX8-4]MBA6363590.1 M1 family metallopeptidase [Colwellia sp. BRX8-8]MBA6371091.1 M1 family metallopeptidase [Colwellia sp. BRX8-4]